MCPRANLLLCVRALPLERLDTGGASGCILLGQRAGSEARFALNHAIVSFLIADLHTV